MKAVTIVDHGMGNLLPVARAFEHCGAAVEVSDRAERIRRADRLVLPGAGAFGDCVAGLESRGLGAAIREFAGRGGPFLGICVGMQMLMSEAEGEGEESEDAAGLGLVPGRVTAIPKTDADGQPHKIPHIGWTAIRPPEGATRERWTGSILEPVAPGSAAYFEHSHSAEPANPAHRLAESHYNGRRISAAIRRANVTATQFHPEKSGPLGLAIISRFLLS